jgi:hypothetical protein
MNKRDICIIGLFSVWFIMSLAAMAGMYHLWWTRERVLYMGKPVDDQRAAIFQRAGLPRETLDLAQKVEVAWPKGVAYEAAGSEVKLSYLKYLLLPRIPSGSPDYRVDENNREYSFSPGGESSHKGLPFSTLAPTALGFILSATILLLVAMGLRRFGLSVPEGMFCASLLLSGLIILTKGLFHSIDAAGWVMLLLALAGAFVVWLRRESLVTNNYDKNRNVLISSAAILIIFGSVFWSFLMAVVVGPDDWDAWAQWGPKAKILALSGGSLSDVRYFVPGSGDYPLLWPSVWAFSSWCAGGWEEQWSKAWGPLFLLLTAWQMGALSFRFTGRRDVGWLTAALFVSMPAVPLIASWAYAEAPLWLSLVCATGRMLLWQQSKKRVDLLLAGLFAAGAACTKNEGALFAALSSLWVILNSHRIRDLLLFLLPSLLTYGLWRAYTLISMDVSNRAVKALESMDWIGNQWFDVLSAAGNHVLRIWTDVRQWNIVLPMLLLVAGWLLFRGLRQDRLNLLLPLTFLAGLFAVVLSHGHDWSWQLGVAWNRLTIQGLVVLIPVMICGLSRRLMQPDRVAS